MAKIPLYNRGMGLSQKTPIGQLSRKPDAGAFISPLQSISNLAKSAEQIAFNFGMAEREREDKRIIDLEYNNAAEQLIDHKFKDKSTNVDQAKKNFSSVENVIKNKIKTKNYGSRRNQLISQSLSKLLNSQRLSSMQDSFDRGQAEAATNSDLNIQKGLETLKGLNPNDPMFGIQTEFLIANQKNADKLSLPTKYNLINLNKSIQDIASNNTRSSFSDKINRTTEKKDLEKIEKEIISASNLSAPTKDVLRNQLKEQENVIDTNNVISFGNFLPIEKVEETTFGTVEGLNATIFNLEKNNKINDPTLQKIWNSADSQLKKRIIQEMNTRVSQAKSNILFENQKKDREESEENEKLLTDFMPKVDNKTASIKEIRTAPWKGAKGIAMRDQLIGTLSNNLEGKQLTDSKPKTYQQILTFISNGKVSDVTEKFTLTGEREGKSILQRVNNDISSNDFTFFRNLIKDIQDGPIKSEAKERLEAYKEFDKFVNANKRRVQGVFAKLDPKADQDFYDFTIQMRRRYTDGLEDYLKRKRKGELQPGESYLDLLDERKDKYILKDTDYFFKTAKQGLENVKDAYKSIEDPTLDQLKPPQKPQGMTIQEFKNSKEFKDYITSGKFKLYLEKMQSLGNQ